MTYQTRILSRQLEHVLDRGKSVLLLGARQTGKTTLLREQCKPDIGLDFTLSTSRREYELRPEILIDEVTALRVSSHSSTECPLVVIDEVQKVPDIIDVAQHLIDKKLARFVLTGSSARKLKKRENGDINLLPGRVIKLQLDALTLMEIPAKSMKIEELLLYGQLPDIFFEKNLNDKEESLISYVDIYLEEEIRQEALVRNLAAFSRFLELAGIEAGNTINVAKLSQAIGVSAHLVNEYFQILEDCLIAEPIEPIIETRSRRKLSKAKKYLFYDLGVRRICAKEGAQLSSKALGALFEQFVGVELCRYGRLNRSRAMLYYWQDHAGPEVDFVIKKDGKYLPIEVKWTDNPGKGDCRHLLKFLAEYPCFDLGYVVCQIPRKRMLTDRIMALPWQELPMFYDVMAD